MIVGIDSGTSLTKFAWHSGGRGTQYRSTADSALDTIYEEIQRDSAGVPKARVIGSQSLEHPFEELPRDEDPIKEEIVLQAHGARHLTGVGRCLVVSIGTGVSYTRVMFGKLAVRMPIGSSLGGGYLNGMRELAGRPWKFFDPEALKYPAPDLMVGDLYPDHPAKDLVLANFGKYPSNPGICAGAVSVVATTIAKDLILYSLLTKDVVFVGMAAQLKSLQKQLIAFQPRLKKRFHFPEHGAFAGALGAMRA